jgi:hypothetical protein
MVGCAASKFLSFELLISPKNEIKNLRQNSKGKNNEKFNLIKSDFLSVKIPGIDFNWGR